MNEEQFLRECGGSYPEAMAALAYFRKSICEQLKAVVQKCVKEFAKVLAVSDKDLKLMEYAPDRPDPNAPNVVKLGWQAKGPDDLILYFYLCWTRQPREESARLSISITIWVEDRRKREGLAAELHLHSEDAAFKDEPWRLDERHFRMDMQESEIPWVAEKLKALSDYTIRFLKSVKGIEEYFRA